MTFVASDAKPKIMWEVREEGETEVVSGENGTIKKVLEIEPGDSYTWLWSTAECCGVYRVYRLTLPEKNKEELVPLKRKIIVKEKPKKTKPEPTLIKLVKT